MAEDATDATVVVEVVVSVSEFVIHRVTSVRSSELAQTSRRTSRGESMAAYPLYWMRSALSAVTLPISYAATLYCLVVARTAASFVGETETMARAPRSLNNSCSRGTLARSDSNFTFAPRAGGASPAPTEEEAKQDSAMVTAKPPSEMSWADCTEPSEARATRQSMRRFSAARSMAGGSPATMEAMALEYSDEENSRCASNCTCRGAACCALATEVSALEMSPLTAENRPSRRRITSPSLRKAIFKTFEASSMMPRTPMTGVG